MYTRFLGNKYMKFRHLLDWAEAHGMEYVVTGHYARVEQDEVTGRFLLKKGLAPTTRATSSTVTPCARKSC